VIRHGRPSLAPSSSIFRTTEVWSIRAAPELRERATLLDMAAAQALERYEAAMNAHDLEAVLDCFHLDYASVQPLNPDRDFRGRDTVRERWTAILRDVPDFGAELLRSAVDGDEEWGEWRWRGTRADGSAIDVRGVTIVGVRAGRIAWGRFYLEEAGGRGGGMHTEVAD
jgi:ketosteroid isomerase-like protein